MYFVKLLTIKSFVIGNLSSQIRNDVVMFNYLVSIVCSVELFRRLDVAHRCGFKELQRCLLQ